MKRKSIIALIGLLLCLFECGILSTMSKEELQKEFYGTWYSRESGYYLDILPDCSINMYECSLHNGIQVNPDITGVLSGTKMTINDDGYPSELRIGTWTEDILFIKNGSALFRVDSIPDQCEDDVIEIIDITPLHVNSGESTVFTVYFEYRLTSVNNAIIEGGVTSSEDGSFSVSSEMSMLVNSSNFGSDSITITAVPKKFVNETKSYFYINLSPANRNADYTPYSIDRRELIVLE